MKLINAFLNYLRAVFGETWLKVLTIFDILGLILFFRPELAAFLAIDVMLLRIVGGSVVLVSFVLANFSVYMKLSEKFSDQAYINLRIESNEFSPSHGSGASFANIKVNDYGFNATGMPDWGSLWCRIKIINIGYERGVLGWEIDEIKTKFPKLFDFHTARVSLTSPNLPVPGRTSRETDLYIDIPFTQRDPILFAKALKDLVKRKQSYQVVLRYWTVRLDDSKKYHELVIKGDFKNFYLKITKHWQNRHLQELIDQTNLSNK